MHDAFMRTIVASPDDDAPRLVYADWLDETEEPANADRAEFIRLQIRLETLPADDPRRSALAEREKALLKKYAKTWAEPFRAIVNGWTFRRGFIESAVVHTEGMGKEFTSLFRDLVEHIPLREVILNQQTDDIGCLLPAAHLMKRLRSFSVRGGMLYSSGHILRKLFESKHLSGVRRLELEGARSHSWFRPRTLSALLQSPVLAKLTDLALADYLTAIHPTVLRTLARSRTLANLKRLSIEDTVFDQTTMRGILRAPYGDGLEVLELRHCRFEQAAWEELLSPRSLPALKRLLLGGADVSQVEVEAARARFGSDAVDTEQEWPAWPECFDWWS